MKIPLVFSLENEIRLLVNGLEDFGPAFNPDIKIADPKFGDLQLNGILPFAKKNGKNPRALADALCAHLQSHFQENFVTFSVAGPGFINIQFSPKALMDGSLWMDSADCIKSLLPNKTQETVVIDYSSPNTAKQMHVGHLRSLVIGETLKRLLRFKGDKVIADNHLGDWGTQFGILLLQIKSEGYDLSLPHADPLEDLEALYKRGSALFKENPEIQEKARQELVKLQNEDPENLKLWEAITQVSYKAFDEIYNLFNVEFDLVQGESFYRNHLEKVYNELEECGLSQKSEGAWVVFHPEHNRFNTMPFIIRKADGASNYATTDLATILHRVDDLNAQRLIYVVDGRQQDHFEQLFLTANKWLSFYKRTQPMMEHVSFGTVLGEDGKAIKTRSGEPIRLKELIAEGIDRAEKIVAEKNPELSFEERKKIAQTVGVSALRYADLSQNRSSDYVFQWDKMLAMEGNTAPYLLYAIARIHSIFRKGEFDVNESYVLQGEFETHGELQLARKLIQFPKALEQTLADLRPHYLCLYLYELAGAFSSFYKSDRIMGEEESVQKRRLLLANRTLKILTLGLDLLGIPALEKM